MLSAFLSILLFISQLLDGWSTRKVLITGGSEANPVARWFMEQLGYWEFFVVKGLVFGGLSLFANAWFAFALLVVYAGVITHNLRVAGR